MTDNIQPKRLSKVARELNVGISTIVDFLSEKGHAIDSNPNAKLDDNLYNILLNEFQAEKKVKEKSQKVSIAREVRETISIETQAPVAVKEKQQPEAEEVLIKNMPVVDLPVQEEEEEKPKSAPGESNIKVVGKIDLDSFKKKSTKESKKEVKEKEVELPSVQAENVVKSESVDSTPEIITVPEPINEVSADDQPSVENIAPAVQETQTLSEDNSSDTSSEVPKVEDQIYKTKVQKLEGPTILGKIELPVKDDKKKPVASSSSYDADKNSKKKRKRIRKTGTGPEENTTQQTAPNKGPVNTSSKPSHAHSKPADKGAAKKPAFVKPEVSEADIQNQIKETLARLSGTGKSKAVKYRKLKREAVSQQMQAELEKQLADEKVLKVTEFVSANEVAKMMGIPVTEIISTCMSLGLFVSINQRLDAETISIVAEEFGYKVEFVTVEAIENVSEIVDSEEDMLSRPPIVTVMGHVDHGKTSLLDYIRKANVIAGEAGGITQHIGAYSVKLDNGKKITFLDTPGHEAFTAMRARGAKVTDVAIIVIAADDSVMPQTVEAINHAQAAQVPIVFAFNKIDKPNANPEKIKEQLAKMNLLVEDWGGKYQSQEIAAKGGKNVQELLDKVLLESELLDLKANPRRSAQGTVIESSLDKGRGYVSTILVQKGTLKVGDVVLAGCFSGKVKALHNERGGAIKEAGPATPVLLLGLNGAPQAGDIFNVMTDEREAREIASKRMQLQREQGMRTQKHITLDEIGRRLAIGDFKELNLIVKGDVDGSVEALSDSLLKLSTDKVQVNVIHKSVGQISESDVLLASASNAIIIGFQVRPSVGARKLAETEQIDIRMYSIIYDAINELKDAIEGMLAPEFEEKIVSNIEIRDVFKITKVGTVAGCMVLDGKISRNTKVRLIRDGIVIYSGDLGSLKRFKDDVKEVQAGYECGLNINNFNDIKVGDIIEGYEMVEIKKK
jgi:translation initiation factor IF-2